jgi:tripartite-type tricarboxylate transporter receptor subunit TctC
MTRTLLTLIAALIACAPLHHAQAQGYPARPVRVLIPYPPGGTADLLARLLGARLAESLGQPFVIENRAGAGGNLAAEAAARAPADGYTLLMANAPVLAVNPSLYDKIPFDPVKDFAPVSLVANVPLLLLVHPGFAARSATDIIAAAKAQPGRINYASAGGGSTTYLATELFKSMAGIQMQAIPYKGSGPALSALVAGEVPLMFELFPSALGHVRGGRVRTGGDQPLALGTDARTAHRRRDRPARLRDRLLVRPGGTGRHAARGGDPAQRRDRAPDRLAGDARAPGHARGRAAQQLARAVRAAGSAGNPQVGQGDQGLRRKGRMRGRAVRGTGPGVRCI